jgi:hypothetical protein
MRRVWVGAVAVVFVTGLYAPAVAGAQSAARLPCATRTERSGGGRWSRSALPSLPPDPAPTKWADYDQWHVSVSHADPRVMYVYNVAHVYKSADGGCTWQESFNIFSGNPNPAPYWSDRIVEVHAPAERDAPAYLLLDRGGVPQLGVQRMGADEWAVAPFATGGAQLAGSPSRLWIARDDPRTLYVAVTAVRTFTRDRLYRSVDGGVTWELRHAFVGHVSGYTWWATDLSCPANDGTCPLFDVRVMEVDPSDANALWAATEDGVFHSDDGGQTWQNVHRVTLGTLGQVGRIDLFRARTGLRIAVLGGTQIAWTSDGGRTWELRDPPFGRGSNGSPPPASLVRGVASHGAERIVAVLDYKSSFAENNVVAQQGRRWTPTAPKASTCGQGLEVGHNCLDAITYVRGARSYYAIEIDGSHLWAFQPRG